MKKLIAVLLALGLLALMGCGKAKESEATTAEPTTTAEATTTTAALLPTTAFPSLISTAQGKKISLPAHANNGGSYVYHNGATYFRQYNADCFEGIGEWGIPRERHENTSKKMMRIDSDGIQTVFDDDGTDGIFIDSKGNFYLNRFKNEDGDYGYEAYSFDPKGKLRWTADNNVGKIFALDETRGLLICEGRSMYSSKEVYAINSITGMATLLATSESKVESVYYDSENGWLYYRDFAVDAPEICIKRVDWQGKEAKKITAIPMSLLLADSFPDEVDIYPPSWVKINHAYKSQGGLQFYFEIYNGNAQHFIDRKLVHVNADGACSAIKNITPSSMFGLFSPFNETNIQYIISDDVPNDYRVCTEYGSKGTVIFSQEEMASIGFPDPYYTREVSRVIRDVAYAGKDVWFTAATGFRDDEYYRSGNQGYKIANVHVYRKSGITGRIELVYEF